MWLSRTSSAGLLLLLTSFHHAASISFDCGKAVAGGIEFNFGKLGGYHQVSWIRQDLETVRNTTFKIDICKPLKLEDKDEKKSCEHGTQICGVVTTRRDDETLPDGAYPIWRNYELEGAPSNPKTERLKDSVSNSDSEKEGLRLAVGGGSRNSVPQRAVIEFICKRTENSAQSITTKYKGRDDGDKDSEHPDWDDARKADDGAGGEIEVLPYSEDSSQKDVLRLNWHTPHGCEDSASSRNGTSSGGWGFFSWFFFIIFMGLFAFILFTAWINYTRHGARGWDLLPYSDTIRDVPYILGDWGRKIVSTLNGGGSRGGYSAV